MRKRLIPTCDVKDLTSGTHYFDEGYKIDDLFEDVVDLVDEEGDEMEEEEIAYKNNLYDLAIIAEHEKANGNLVCPRCGKEYHMLEFDEDEAELRAEADHGPYECWQTHLEMGFCEATEADKDPKAASPSDAG